MSKTTSTSSPMVTIQLDPEFVPLQIMGYLSIINCVMEEVIYDEPTNEHQRSVRAGLCYLTWHVEDLMRAYLDSKERRDDHDEEGMDEQTHS